MNIEQHTIDPLNAELTIRLEPGDYSERFEKALRDYRKRLQLPGFRPGHVPAALVKQRFGKSLLAEEINSLLQESINQYITDKKLEILGNPLPKDNDEFAGNWDEPGDFKFSYELGLAPNFEVPLNKNEKFDFFKVMITDELINKQVKDMSRRFGKVSEVETSGPEELLMVKLEQLDSQNEVVENGIKNDTTVSIEYVKDDATRNSLIGLKKDDQVVVDPEKLSENHEDLAKMLGITHHDVHHLDGNFKLTVTGINKMEPHELNAELFSKYYPNENLETEEQFREKVKTEMSESFEKDHKWLFRKNFVKEIVNRINPQLPDSFLKRWISMTNEKPINPEELDYIYPSQAFQLKWQLIENKITRDHNVKVELQDAINYLKDSMKKQFVAYNIPADEDFLEKSAKDYLGDREKASKVYENLHEEKMFDVIMDLCNLVEKPISYEEFVHKVQH